MSIKGNPFTRAAWFINDWIEMMEQFVLNGEPNPDKAVVADVAEARGIVERMTTLAGQFEKARKHSGAEQAATIIAGMLADFGLVGSVWYSPKGRRFRLTGDGHQPGPAEVFIGAYLPDSDVKTLAADFADALASESFVPPSTDATLDCKDASK